MAKRRKRFTVKDALRAELETTKKSLDTAHSNFENVVDQDLIDCYIYEVNAAQLRYTFLLKKLKEYEESTSAG